MTKEEKIKEAYNSVGLGYLIEQCDNEAWVEISGHIRFVHEDKLDRYEYNRKDHIIRPKSLSGIENNNGWNLMKDFDGDDRDYFLFLRYSEGDGEPPIFTSVLSDDFQIGYFTHWRKIDISKPPIY